MKSFFPNLWQSILICIGMVTIVVLAQIAAYFTNQIFTGYHELIQFIQYLISVGIVVLTLLSLHLKINVDAKAFELKKVKLSTWLAITFLTFVFVVGIVAPLTNLIPLPDFMKALLKQLMNQTGIYTFLMTVICAPILEEYIFRGVILRGLLKKYSPLYAILITSIFFGLVHLNPWQFISGLLIGSLSGWLYYKTSNLLPSILVHIIANGIGYFSRFYYDESYIDMEYIDAIGGPMNYTLTLSISILVFSVGIYYLNRSFNKTPNKRN